MRLVCITGMRGTGIAAVARLTDVLTVDLGSVEERGGPASTTMAHQGFTSLADDVMASAWQADWQRPPALPDGAETSLQLHAFRRRAAHLVASSFAPQAEVAAWADHRAGLLLPFWRTAAPVDAEIVTLRDPRETAADLLLSDGLSSEHAAELWVRYTIGALRNSRRPLLVHHHDLHGEPVHTLDRIAAHLGLTVSNEQRDTARHRVDAAPSASGRQSTGSGPWLRVAVSLHELLVTHGWSGPVPPVAEQLHREWVATGVEARRRITSDETVDRCRRELAEARGHHDALRDRIVRLEGQLAEERQDRAAQAEVPPSDAVDLRHELRAAERDRAAVEQRLRRAEGAERAARRDLERLRARRSVRLALRASAPLRPVFRRVRTARTRRKQDDA